MREYIRRDCTLANGLRESISDETEPPARTALASGLRESISEETVPPARAASAICLRERISEEIVPEARHSRVTRYATQERAGTVHLQAVSVPEVRHYPRLFRNKKVPQAMLTELFALQDGLEPTTP